MKQTVLCVVLCVLIAGCAATPQQRLVTAADSYASIASVAATLRTSGLIPDNVWTKVKESDTIAWAALQMYRLSITGGQADQTQLDAFNRAIAVISDEVKKILSPTSQPVKG
jgi:hypothetical protein